jgi:hypothetical protein
MGKDIAKSPLVILHLIMKDSDTVFMVELVRWQMHLALRPWAISYEMRRPKAAATACLVAPARCPTHILQSVEYIYCRLYVKYWPIISFTSEKWLSLVDRNRVYL